MSAHCPMRRRAVTEFFADDIHPGDVFLLNDPYHGGNHLPDLTVFVPVFAGERAAFLVDQPRPSERHRRRDARRLQRRRHRHLAGGDSHHAVAAL